MTRCKWCGRTYQIEYSKLTGFAKNRKYCSDRCKLEAEGGRSESNPNQDTGGIIGGMFKEKEKSAEQINAEAEERRRKEQEEREALERDRAKAKELKSEGKKWLAMWYSMGQYGRALFGLGVACGLFIGSLFIANGNGFGIILLLIGVIGLVFAAMFIKDALK